jgi:hypothetical protein
MLKPRTKLTLKIADELKKDKPTIENILRIFDSFQMTDSKTLEKLKREKKGDMKKIHGALKQTINAHGPITKELMGSASKRIYGSMLVNPNGKEKKKKINPISIRDVIIGIIFASLVFLLLL